MVVTEGKYIYFRRFMIRKRDLVLAALGVTVVLAIVSLLFFALFQKSPEEKEIDGIMAGKNRDIGGTVLGVDQNDNKIIEENNDNKILYYKKVIKPSKEERDNHSKFLKTSLKKNFY